MATRFNTKGKFLRSFLAPDSIFIDIMMNVGIIAGAGLETTGWSTPGAGPRATERFRRAPSGTPLGVLGRCLRRGWIGWRNGEFMTSPPTVLTFGEALVGYASVEDNLRAATQFTRFPGGADLNVAVGLTRLGVRTIWASVLGEDAHADYMADAVDQLGVTSLVRRASGPTALMFKAGGATGDPEVLQVTVTPVDTVGAGDGFAAGHLAAFLVGDSMQERVDQGAAVGALVTTRRGDLAAMPQREEVDALINSTPTRQVVPATRHG